MVQFSSYIKDIIRMINKLLELELTCPFFDRCGEEGFCSIENPCVVSELVSIWNSAGYNNDGPELLLKPKQVKANIVKLYGEYQTKNNSFKTSQRKIEKMTGEKKLEAENRLKERKKEYTDDRNKCFIIAVPQILEKIRTDRKRTNDAKTQDEQFYIDQTSERKMMMDNRRDKVYSSRHEKACQKQLPKQNTVEEIETEEVENLSSEDTESDTDDDSPMIQAEKSKKMKRTDQLTISISVDEIVKATSIPCVRGNIGVQTQTGIVASILKKANVDLDSVVFSESTVTRIRDGEISIHSNTYKENIAKKFKDKPVLLHFDTKKVNEVTADNVTREIERLAISVTSPDPNEVEGLDNKDDELLHVVEAESGKGMDQALEIYNILLAYGFESQVIGVCTDTTGSNTGRYKGAITLLEKYLGKPLLWIMCRRHATEVHITHAMTALTGSKTKGPRRQVYTRLQKVWPEVHEEVKASKFILFDWKKHRGTILGQLAEESLRFCTRALITDVFARGDYKKLVENTVVYLGGTVANYVPAQPFACHEARFTADGWYLTILRMTSNTINVLSPDERKWIESAADIVAAIYVPHFLKSPIIIKAPQNDLEMMQNLLVLKDFPQYEEVGFALLCSFQRHMWYLCEDVIILSLLDDDVSDEAKVKICNKLLSCEGAEMEDLQNHGKGIVTENTELADFVGPRSWLLFHSLNFKRDDLNWLECPPEDWPSSTSYQQFDRMARGIVCTNDVAERAIKLVQVKTYEIFFDLKRS